MKPLTHWIQSTALALALACTALTAHAASPRAFIEDASAKGLAEIRNGQLAEQKSQSEAVKTYAREMIHDHEAANRELASIAESLSIKLPGEADMLDRVKSMILEYREGSFDKAYADNQVKAHEQSLELFKDVDTSRAPELKGFLDNAVPRLEQHLEEAKKLQKEVASSQ